MLMAILGLLSIEKKLNFLLCVCHCILLLLYTNYYNGYANKYGFCDLISRYAIIVNEKRLYSYQNSDTNMMLNAFINGCAVTSTLSVEGERARVHHYHRAPIGLYK